MNLSCAVSLFVLTFCHFRKKDERLWEVQRILTQLKRKNRDFQKLQSQTKLDTLTMESLERKRSLLRNSPGGRSNRSTQELDPNILPHTQQPGDPQQEENNVESGYEGKNRLSMHQFSM